MENKYEIILPDIVEKEIDEVVAIYQKYGIHTAEKLVVTIEAIQDILSEMPESGREISENSDIRRRSLPKYPYSFYYRVNHSKLEVIAFIFTNDRQDPENIGQLISERIKGWN